MKRILILLLSLSLATAVPAQRARQSQQKKTTQKKTTSKKSTAKKTTTPTPSTPGIDKLKNERSQIQAKIKKQESALRANKANVQKRLVSLMAINSEIEAQERSIADLENDIRQMNSNIDILSAQLETLEQQLEERKQKYARSLRYVTRHDTFQDRLMFVFSAQNFAQMYRRMRFVKEYAAYQRAQGEILKVKQQQVDEKRQQLQQARKTKEALLVDIKRKRAALEGKQQDQQDIVATLQKEQKVIQGIIDEDKARQRELDQKIDQLVQAEIARVQKEAAEKAAREKAQKEEEARRKAAELQRKKEAEERERQRRIERAKAEERRRAEEAAAAKAAAEAARREAAERAQAAADAAARSAAAEEQRLAEQRAREADQRAREAEANRQAMERKAAAEAEKAAKEVAKAKEEAQLTLYNSVDQQLATNFEANKGRLPIPITGSYRIVSHYGQHNVEGLSGVKLDNKGINILGTPGCQARSIFDGEVSAVANVGGTMLVMVRHGRYISVYCNLSRVTVQKGQKVSARQVLGTVGQDNILQFQLRKETAKINPESWLAR